MILDLDLKSPEHVELDAYTFCSAVLTVVSCHLLPPGRAQKAFWWEGTALKGTFTKLLRRSYHRGKTCSALAPCRPSSRGSKPPIRDTSWASKLSLITITVICLASWEAGFSSISSRAPARVSLANSYLICKELPGCVLSWPSADAIERLKQCWPLFQVPFVILQAAANNKFSKTLNLYNLCYLCSWCHYIHLWQDSPSSW
jgi:hypothetical protein